MNANSSVTQERHYFAEFSFAGSPGCLVRKDTRIYYHPQDPAAIVRKAGRCAGVVWMCNPGSAGQVSGPHAWKDISPDATLRAVLSLYQRAVALKNPAAAPGTEEFIQVMNCYYAVGKDAAAAYAEWLASGCPYHERFPKKARFIVAAWGADKPQGPIWRSIRAIRQQRKRKGSSLFVVYIDAPTLRANPARLSSRLAAMNYPVHPLNRLFEGDPPDLASALKSHV